MDKKQILSKNVVLLSEITDNEVKMQTQGGNQPSIEAIERIIDLLKQIIFPGFFGAEIRNRESRYYHIGVCMEELETRLKEQIRLSFKCF
ncbi:MAG: serine acetyltransferase, partial [Bacteroidales bacterium]|nr:serine acetyltransferase [Bacteroidales bacterium]